MCVYETPHRESQVSKLVTVSIHMQCGSSKTSQVSPQKQAVFASACMMSTHVYIHVCVCVYACICVANAAEGRGGSGGNEVEAETPVQSF